MVTKVGKSRKTSFLIIFLLVILFLNFLTMAKAIDDNARQNLERQIVKQVSTLIENRTAMHISATDQEANFTVEGKIIVWDVLHDQERRDFLPDWMLADSNKSPLTLFLVINEINAPTGRYYYYNYERTNVEAIDVYYDVAVVFWPRMELEGVYTLKAAAPMSITPGEVPVANLNNILPAWIFGLSGLPTEPPKSNNFLFLAVVLITVFLTAALLFVLIAVISKKNQAKKVREGFSSNCKLNAIIIFKH
jgi:hypothetical protein